MKIWPFSSLAIAAVLMIASAAYVNGQDIDPVVQRNVDTLIRTNACPGCDLRGVDLNRMTLSGADLKGADLREATFFLADLSGADLRGADLRGAKFGGADLADTDLREADLSGALMDGAYLERTVMDGGDVEEEMVDLDDAAGDTQQPALPDQSRPKELSEQKKASVDGEQQKSEMAVPKQSEVEYAKTVEPVQPEVENAETMEPVRPADETVVAKTVTPPEQVEINDAQAGDQDAGSEGLSAVVAAPGAVDPVEKPVQEIEEKELVETVDASIKQEAAADAESAEQFSPTEALIEKLLDRKRCYGCDLSGADLTGKDLSGADLEGADLSGAVLVGTDLAGANLKGANLSGARLNDADLRKADLYKADLSNSDLTDADLRGTEMDEADFTGAAGYQPPVMLQ